MNQATLNNILLFNIILTIIITQYALACAVHKGPPCEVSGGLECRPSRARTWVWRLPAWPMLLRAYNGTITASGRIVGWLVCQNDVNIIWCFGYPTARFHSRVECSQTHWLLSSLWSSAAFRTIGGTEVWWGQEEGNEALPPQVVPMMGNEMEICVSPPPARGP